MEGMIIGGGFAILVSLYGFYLVYRDGKKLQHTNKQN